MDLSSSDSKMSRSEKRTKVTEEDNGKFVTAVDEEKVELANSSFKSRTPILEVQPQAATSFSSGPVINLFNGTSIVTFNFNHHSTKQNFVQFGHLGPCNCPEKVR